MITHLSLIGELNNESADWKRRFVGVVVVDALGSHVAGENSAVGGETSNGDADVVIDLEDLLLVRRELGIGLVYTGQYHMGLGSEPYGGRTLLHGFHGVLHLEQTPRWAPRRHIRVVLVPEHLNVVVSRFRNSNALSEKKNERLVFGRESLGNKK